MIACRVTRADTATRVRRRFEGGAGQSLNMITGHLNLRSSSVGIFMFCSYVSIPVVSAVFLALISTSSLAAPLC